MKSTDESSGGAGEFKKVHLFLFNDLLVITRPPSLMSRDKYQLIVSLDVTNMSMSDVTEGIDWRTIICWRMTNNGGCRAIFECMVAIRWIWR